MRHFFWIFLLFLLGVRIFFYLSLKPVYRDQTAIRIKATVTGEPLRFENSQYLKIEGLKIYLPKYPEVNYGDKIVVEGVVQGKFLKNAKLVSVSSSQGILIKFRQKLLHFYQQNLHYRHASLVAGVVLGSKEGIDSGFWESLKKTGTLHVVVASGMNVAIVAKFLISFLILIFPRRKAIPLAIVGLWSYGIMSGFDAPIIRAVIMGTIAFTAQEIGKVYYAGRALIISAILMILVKTEWIVDFGFILSFIATASILLLDEPVRNFFKKVPAFLRSDLSASLSAQIGVTPILFASFGQFNILSPLYNIAVLWTIPLITMIGMVSGIASLVYVPLARLILFLVYPFTAWFIFSTNLIR